MNQTLMVSNSRVKGSYPYRISSFWVGDSICWFGHSRKHSNSHKLLETSCSLQVQILEAVSAEYQLGINMLEILKSLADKLEETKTTNM